MTSRAAFIDYYASIIPNPEQLHAYVDKPLPTCFWVNPLKADADEVCRLLTEDGFSVERLAWHPHAFRCHESPMRLSKHWGYGIGLWHIQEEVSMLSGQVLEAKPGERVLDLCAAPGNKTAQLSVSMHNTGTVVANDRSYGRLRGLGQAIRRLGLMNVTTTVYDGTRLPRMAPLFDKVLVDAPCSCEGTIRKNPNKSVVPNRDKSLRQASTQLALLKKAFQVCKPGGRILYSTCTFAPEENERVLHEFLKTYPHEVKVVPIEVPELTVSPGITTWHGEFFDPSVQGAIRIWPHQNNTGGFFLALLEKADADDECDSLDSPRSGDSESPDIAFYQAEFTARFGFESSFWESYRFSSDTQRGVYALPWDHASPPALTADASGLFAIKGSGHHLKLTTAAAMMWWDQAKRHVIELNDAQRTAYLQRETCVLDEVQQASCEGTGYVLVTHAGYGLGTGLYLAPQDGAPGRLKSLFPKVLS